jgi:hypothetical protein
MFPIAAIWGHGMAGCRALRSAGSRRLAFGNDFDATLDGIAPQAIGGEFSARKASGVLLDTIDRVGNVGQATNRVRGIRTP